MTPEEALQILDRLVALTSMNREGHIRFMEAIKVLTNTVKVREFPKAKENS